MSGRILEIETDAPLGVVPQQARSRAKRDALLNAALAEYDRHGVAGARVDHIVGEVGVGWGTFFHYFPRKQDVLLAAGVEIQRELAADLDAWLANPRRPVYDVLRAFYDALARPHRSGPLHVAIIREVLASPVRFEAMLGDLVPMYVQLAAVLKVGQGRGEVRGDNPAETMAGVLHLAVLATMARTGLPGKTGAVAGDLRRAALSSFDLVWAGIEDAAAGRP